MRFGSVCSGIEAASVAWNPLGWKAAWLSEIEPFPCSLLAHHYLDTPNFGDMTKFESWPTDGNYAIDLLCGGTPCQSFSAAGLRKGLDDPRGNLMLTFGAVAAKYRPRWVVWENVPGVLSSNGGRDFGAFLGMLGQLGYGYAYRIFDAQYFGVAQRRRRVFVVGCAGDWRAAAAVLFERHSLSGHPAPRRSAPKNIAGAITSGAFAGGADGRPEGAAGNHFIPVTGTLSARTKGGGGLGTDFECSGGLAPVPHAEISPALKARDHKGPSSDGDGNGAILIPMAYGTPGNWISRKPENGGNAVEPMLDLAPCQTKTDVHAVCAPTLTSNGDSHSGFRDEQGLITNGQMRVRRLTPTECERLQGFPDSYTSIPVKKVRPNRLQSPRADKSYREINGEVWQLASDGPRYKALGNSWAVPCARWIGERIEMVDKIAADA